MNEGSSVTPPTTEAEGTEASADIPGRSRKSRRPPRRHLSEVLAEIAADTSREAITVTEIVRILEGRARAALILLFAAPNVLPAPPGISSVLGLPLLYLTTQMMLGRMPWLPKVIGNRGLPLSTFASLVDRAQPILTRAERLLQPRWWVVVGPTGERVLGAVCLVLAVVLTLPVPLGNMLPALAICVIALGALERDGLWASIGVLIGVGALALTATVVWGLIKAGVFILQGAFA
jgi:hypothetical protein